MAAATKLSRAEFQSLLRRAGIDLAEDQAGEIYRAWGTLEGLIERLHQRLPPEAEPAVIFTLGDPP